MKKTLIFLATLSLFIPIATSEAAVKAGDVCKKQNQKITSKGRTFTCIKSGKKLVWNKGVLIKNGDATQDREPSSPVIVTPTPPVIEPKEGDSCEKLGDTRQNKLGFLECRDIAGNKLIWVQLSETPPAIVNSAIPENVEVCKLPDLRTQKTPGQGAAFPLNQGAFSPIGTVRVAVIPFDFPDAPGDSNIAETIASEQKRVDAWLAFNSSGKQRYQWNIVKEWIRAPKSSETYNWINPGNPQGVQVLSDGEIANQLFSAASSKIDLSQLDYIFMVFPKDQRGILQEIAGRSRPVNTPKGTFNLSYFGAGRYFFTTNQPIWSLWIHEALHSQGLAMHAPGNGSPLHMGGNQSAVGTSLSGWDKFVSGWLDDRQVFCLQDSNIANQRVTLASTDRADNGYKVAIIKISQSEAIVIESRRRTEVSSGFPLGTYGLNAYVVQTAQNNERCDRCNQDEIEKKQFAFYLRAEGVERGSYQAPMAAAIRWSTFVREGEYVTFRGVKVALEKSGDYDTILITK